MKISNISIEQFRSIKKCQLRLNEITTVVGENNAGKTALLRALNSVFNWEEEKRFFDDNTHQYAPRTVTKIYLTFEDVPSKSIYNGKVYNDKLILGFTYSYSTTRRKKTLFCSVNGSEITVDDTFISELKKDIDYVYIPANRGNTDLIWNESSVFRKVLIEYSQFFTQSRDNASAQVSRVGNALKNSIFSKIEREIENMSMLDSPEHYCFGYTNDLDYSIFLNHVGIQINDAGKCYPVTEYGSGIQSLSVIALYRALAKIKNVNVVLGLEEPEINLHPHAQKKLIASIKNKRQETEVQAIMTTHSTVIVDELEHEDVILARRVNDEHRGFHTEFSQLEDDFWSRYNLDEFKHNKFFKYKNSEFFFSKYIIIAESSTDAEIIRNIIEEPLGEKMYYISILNLDGIDNLKYPYFLLKSLGMEFSMVVDMDFLTQYKNDTLKNSRNPITYLPEYKGVLKEHNPVIDDIWKTAEERNSISTVLSHAYSRIFDLCKTKHIFPMQYCLEMDLIASVAGKDKYCEIMRVTNDDTANKKLLEDKKDAIKDAKNVFAVVSALTPPKYPYSYKRIRKAICEDIDNCF